MNAPAAVLVLGMMGCAAHASTQTCASSLPVPPASTQAHAKTAPRVDYRDYSSNRGDVRLTGDVNGAITGVYPQGIMACERSDIDVIVDQHVVCYWYERAATGRAAFVIKEDGSFHGTWGMKRASTTKVSGRSCPSSAASQARGTPTGARPRSSSERNRHGQPRHRVPAHDLRLLGAQQKLAR